MTIKSHLCSHYFLVIGPMFPGGHSVSCCCFIKVVSLQTRTQIFGGKIFSLSTEILLALYGHFTSRICRIWHASFGKGFIALKGSKSGSSPESGLPYRWHGDLFYQICLMSEMHHSVKTPESSSFFLTALFSSLALFSRYISSASLEAERQRMHHRI